MKLYIAGHTGLVGSALMRRFAGRAGVQVVTATRREVDLTEAQAVRRFLERERPDTVVLAAGAVGGIRANAASPATFIYDNLMIQANVVHAAWQAGVQRLINFGSSCMYPKHAPQPMLPELLMTGKLEPTSEPYAMAKLAGTSLISAYNRQYRTRFCSAIPATVYGPGDNFDPDNAHVLSALLRKFHAAKRHGLAEVTLWGTGAARREFLYADDLAEACEVLLRTAEAPELVNIGSGISEPIAEIAPQVAEVVGFKGRLRWDASQPEGAPMKLLDSKAIRALGWQPRTELPQGLAQTYQWFVKHAMSQAEKEGVPCGSS